MSDELAATQPASNSGGNITNSTFWNTVTSARDLETTSVNYWPEFGTLQYFELTYIILLIVLGTFGNCTVIFSIIVSRKVHSNGNIFVINLALADLMICVITLPSMAANILATRNILPKLTCDIVGYIVTATCGCSLANLSLIAFNRYWAVVRYASYRRRFTSRVGISMAIGAWIWSILLVLPSALGWGGFTFDAKALLCTWNEGKSISYSIFLIGSGIAIPLIIIAFSYFKVFSTVKSTGKWRRSLHSKHGSHTTSKRLSQRERSLLRTLLATVVAFCICWTPYSMHVLIDPVNISPHLKKFLVWLALTNSCVNFIIYGVLNPSFKRGYRRLFYFVFRCFNDNSVPLRTRTAWSSGQTGNQSGIQMHSLSPQAIESPSVDEVTALAMNQMNGNRPTAISPERRIAQESLSICERLKELFTKKPRPSSLE